MIYGKREIEKCVSNCPKVNINSLIHFTGHYVMQKKLKQICIVKNSRNCKSVECLKEFTSSDF